MGANYLILVTVGTQPLEFTRLIMEMDKIAGEIDEKVIIQTGHGKLQPKNAEYFNFISKDEIEEIFKKARVIVSHAGMGTIITATKHKKPLIIVPRLKDFKEEPLDDHQVEICKMLEDKIQVIWNIKDLKKAIDKIDENRLEFKSVEIISCLKKYITMIEN